ncbi:hypothetical protein MA16_Dca013442 [Dendrobium catenatum]|uniref:Uncharacterized protein n=1 Tax=Dendrobium catenatum TaxID=906689 RepID=A0A2I0WPR1_9ASPA|nr:hypothetical protein MA16_Dca013442 [Dendrobium catenatum]
MTNCSARCNPFSIVYPKAPNHILGVVVMPKCCSQTASNMATQFISMLSDVCNKLAAPVKHTNNKLINIDAISI